MMPDLVERVTLHTHLGVPAVLEVAVDGRVVWQKAVGPDDFAAAVKEQEQVAAQIRQRSPR